MLRALFRFHAPLLLLLLSPAGALGQDLAGPAGETEERVAALFQRSCAAAGCHVGGAPQMGMNLGRRSFFSATVGARSLERPDLLVVDPGHPERSYLQMKIEGAAGIIGLAMPPPPGHRLAQEDVEMVRRWIGQLTEADLSRRAEARPQEPEPFLGWKVVNLPTNQEATQGDLLFAIGHRFNPEVGAGMDALFGIDGSSVILLSLGYAPTDRLLVSLGRSNADDDVELGVRYLFARQRAGAWPLSVGATGAVNWFTEEPVGTSAFRSDAIKLSTQLVLTRAFGDWGGAALVPGLLLNPSAAEDGEPPLVTLGLGGRVRVYRNVALVAEWVPIVAGYARTRTFGNDNRFDSWAGGLEIATAGHVFQIVGSNSVGLATDQYLRGGDLDIREPAFRLGFNIFRVLEL